MPNFFKGLLGKGFLPKSTAVNAARTPSDMGSLHGLRMKIKANPVGGFATQDARPGNFNVSGFLEGTKMPGSADLKAARAARIARMTNR